MVWGFMALPFYAFGQNDSSQIGYIYVGRSAQKIASQPQYAVNRDFIRQRVLYRLSFMDGQNACLLKATDPSNPYLSGIVLDLMKNFQKGKLTALSPANPNQVISYPQFIEDMLYLQGTPLTASQEFVDPESIMWEALTFYIDIIADEGFSERNSREFFRPQFVRLTWYLPEAPKGIHGLLLFRYKDILPLIQKTTCQNGYDLSEWIRFKEFTGKEISLEKDRTRVLIRKK